MAAGQRRQSNTTLYAVVAFVGLFIIATAAAIFYYVKFEEQRGIAEKAQRDLERVATREEVQKIGTIVGTQQPGKSWLGTMADYLDEMVYLIIGGPSEATSAEVKTSSATRKVEDVNKKVKEVILLAQERIDIEPIDPNAAGLIRIIKKLKEQLDNTVNAELAVEKQLDQLHNRFDEFQAETRRKEQDLLAEKERYQQQVNEIKQEYDELEALLQKSTDEQIQLLNAKVKEQEDKYDEEHAELLRIQAQLKMAEERIEYLREQIESTMPSPDPNVMAYKPDGEIIFIDDQTQTVHLDIGSDDHVYRGLTFSVYDKGIPVPKDGKGKTEIEVFDVREKISIARIIPSKTKSPIMLGDIVANLIWDSDKINAFVVVGEFDLDDDGDIEHDAVDKIKALIEKWGGKVADEISVDTDFLVLGRTPQVRARPTPEEMEVYPMAMERYQASLQKLAHYKDVQEQAKTLSIPVFNYERFLDFIGYKAQADRAGAF